MVSKGHECSVTLAVEFVLHDVDDLLEGGGNFFLTDPGVIMGSAVPCPEQIRIFRSNLVYLIENVLKCVLRDITRV